MRIVLMANESVGYECLKALVDAHQDLLAVVTDARHANTIWRNLKLKRLAEEANVPHLQTRNINEPEFVAQLEELSPDIIFNIAFVQIYKAPVLAIPRLGAINFHPGPLPKYGGSNGWVWAIINGDTEYGVAFHYMKEKVDTGAILGIERFPIDEDETGLSLLTKCYAHGARLFERILPDILNNTIVPVSQDLGERSYFYNRAPNEGFIDVRWSAGKIERFVRALDFSPLPNPLSPPKIKAAGQDLIVSAARIVTDADSAGSKPGEVLDIRDNVLVVQTGDGVVGLTAAKRGDRDRDAGIANVSKGDVVGG